MRARVSDLQRAPPHTGRTYGEAEEDAAALPYGVTSSSGKAEDKASPAALDARGTPAESAAGAGGALAPEQVSAEVLRALASAASERLGSRVRRAVVTVPAYFNEQQRQGTRSAGQIAGLEVLRIINEPTAAALAYGLQGGSPAAGEKRKTALVFDLGGGTFDVSVLELGDGVFEVLATAGDGRLGGDDFDRCVAEWLLGEFARQHKVDAPSDPAALQRVAEAAEQAKRDLSEGEAAEVTLPFLAYGADGKPRDLEATLTRKKFEALCKDLVERLRGPTELALKDAGLWRKFPAGGTVDELVLVGGATRMACAQAVARKLCGGKAPVAGVDPDEAVALGAAVQGAIASRTLTGIVLSDVNSLSIGIEKTVPGENRCEVLVPRNSRLPARGFKVYSTSAPNQRRILVNVLQGERPFAKDNKLLGQLYLEGIPPAPKGVPKIAVTLNVDRDGLVTVEAVEETTGKRRAVKLVSAGTLSDVDVERMVREAARYAREDAERAAKQDVLLRGDSLNNRVKVLLMELAAQEKKLAKWDKSTKTRLGNVGGRIVMKQLELDAAVVGGDDFQIERAEAALLDELKACGQGESYEEELEGLKMRRGE